MTNTVVEHRKHIIVRLIITYLYFRPGTRILSFICFHLVVISGNVAVEEYNGNCVTI